MKQLIKRIDKPWGYELIWADTPFYIAKKLFIRAGFNTSLKYHNRKIETLYLQSGQAIFVQDGNGVIIEPGEAYHIPTKSVHQLEAFTDCVFFEVSLPFPEDVVRIADRYGRRDENVAYPVRAKKGIVDPRSVRPSGNSIQTERWKGYPDLLSDRLPEEPPDSKRV